MSYISLFMSNKKRTHRYIKDTHSLNDVFPVKLLKRGFQQENLNVSFVIKLVRVKNMNIANIESNIRAIIDNFDKETFIYDLLSAYKLPKASITRLKKGTLNLSKKSDEIIWKKKLYFKEAKRGDLYHSIDDIHKDKTSIKHQPRFIVVTDYKTLLAIDTKTGESLDIQLDDLARHFDFFLPWAGLEKAQVIKENRADVKAAIHMAKLYDEIKRLNPIENIEDEHRLNVFLTRILFCFFAEDTGIYQKAHFTNSIKNYTKPDGSDLNLFLDELFSVLNTEKRSRGRLPEFLEKFPYVNGGLFKEVYNSPNFSKRAREMLVDNGNLNWSDINPDIFGSMMQSVVSVEERSNLGMHYTSVPNIMKLIKPLFLDELMEEFENGKHNKTRLSKLHNRLSKLKIFDPACGSGNFLVIAYKEIRNLEMEIIKQLNKIDSKAAYSPLSLISLSQFYGIEVDDFAHETAILSLWLTEHQMNVKFLEEFGNSTPTLPLKQGGNIIHGNATRINWEEVCSKKDGYEIYILGNPPYLGARKQEKHHKDDLAYVFQGVKKYKNLDYISCWFFKATKFIHNSRHKFAFVSTNSLSQGEQVALIWPLIYNYKVSINFAYTPFKWTNNAKKTAGITCVIIGFESVNTKRTKKIYTSDHIKFVNNISPYLTDGDNTYVERRKKQISGLPKMHFGNMPNDGGGLILTEEEKQEIEKDYPNSTKYFKKLVGSNEYIYGTNRWCLWVEDDSGLAEIYNIPPLMRRIETVRQHRLNSKDKGTNKLAERPHQFRDLNTCDKSSLIIPSVSSEKRKYIPIGFLDNNSIISNLALAIYDPEPWLFGFLTSHIHMVWVKAVAGGLETRTRYSAEICYNTFPVPSISSSQKSLITEYVYKILEEREMHSEKTLAQLYKVGQMPENLLKIHLELDDIIEKCYRKKGFNSDQERLEYLFSMYKKINK